MLELPFISPLDESAQATARARQAALTKPPGSLGTLEKLSLQIAGITGLPRPSVDRKVVIILAADHGIAAEGVSAYPANVTAQMINVQLMEEAVRKAKESTRPSAHPPIRPSIVLLSTASPSYNMYKNFEEKGDVFRKCIFG